VVSGEALVIEKDEDGEWPLWVYDRWPKPALPASELLPDGWTIDSPGVILDALADKAGL
jgi:hypothetical protein